VVFFFPEMGGFFLEHANFEQADNLKTPVHIAPVWYFGAFYAILRAIPDKLLGVVAMGGAIAILFVVPWLDRSPVKSCRYKGWISRTCIVVFGFNYLLLVKLDTPLQRRLVTDIRHNMIQRMTLFARSKSNHRQQQK
jgi:ubiquinol-cytochrome c reductase cytochrome b subunit